MYGSEVSSVSENHPKLDYVASSSQRIAAVASLFLWYDLSMTQPPLLRIAVPCPLRQAFDYWAPSSASPEQCVPGVRVRVPFGRRELVGVCIDCPLEPDIDPKKIKAALEILDDQPILSKSLLALLTWTSQYYHHPIGETLCEALPIALRQGKPSDPLSDSVITLTEKGLTALANDSLKRAKQQLSALSRLSNETRALSTDLKRLDISPATRRALEKKALITTHTEAHKPWSYTPSQKGHTLNDEQQHAVDTIHSADGFRSFLCAGITGSGKTEVYYQAMEPILAAGKAVLLLVPEIALTPQTLNRLAARFHVPVTATHSGLNDNERYQAWLKAYYNQAAIIVGTRSAVFTPCPTLGMIVVDESHDTAFKQMSGLRYHARDLAVKRAYDSSIPIILGTATPTLESLYNAERGHYRLLTLTKRAGLSQPPQITCIPQHRDFQHTAGLSPAIIDAINQCLSKKKQVLLFLNRRGYAPLFLCHHCGAICHCERCDANMTYHRDKNRLVCHQCDRSQVPPAHCASCQQANHVPYGLGTEQLEDACHERFPDARVCRIDRDTTRNTAQLKEQLNRIHDHEADILIGTQMLAKGHHIKALHLVVIINADQGFFCSDFRAIERTGQLIMQVAGRCGRGKEPGTVIIQTALPDFPPLKQLIDDGYLAFAKHLLKEREDASLPPLYAFAIIGAQAKSADEAEGALHHLRQWLKQHNDIPATLLGPMPALCQKVNDTHRFQLGLLTTNKTQREHLLLRIDSYLARHKNNRVRFLMDVDAQTLL